MRQFLRTRYVRGGRGPVDYDCWGLVRDARSSLFGRALLPTLQDARPGELRGITRAVDQVIALHGFAQCAPRVGAVATAWRASLCVHVGLVVEVDGQLRILETDEPDGPCLTALNRFQARYTRVLFYDDQDLPRTDAEPACGVAPMGGHDCGLVCGGGH